MARRLIREEGLLVGGSSGTAVATALRVAARGCDGPVVVGLADSWDRHRSRPWLRPGNDDRPLHRCPLEVPDEELDGWSPRWFSAHELAREWRPMITALTRAPGPELARCELTYLSRQPIDPGQALAQHRAYQVALRDAGACVIELSADPALPDGVFVEDAAVVLDEVAVLTSPGPTSRRGEVVAVAAALAPFRRLDRLPPDAFLEGGDVLRVGRTLFVGLSGRTGEAGLRALDGIVRPLGYSVVPVRVTECLHLKSAACAVDEETVLVNRAWVETDPFGQFRLADVAAAEPFGANVLRLPGVVLASAAFPETADLIRGLGHKVLTVDVSELHKAESGMTCMSLVFDVPTTVGGSRDPADLGALPPD